MAGNRPLYWNLIGSASRSLHFLSSRSLRSWSWKRPPLPSDSSQLDPGVAACRAGCTRCWAASSCSKGVSSEKPAWWASASAKRVNGVVAVRRGQAAMAPLRSDSVRIADQHGRVGAVLHAEPFAGRAPAERAVEREVMRIAAARSCGRTGRRRSAGCSARPSSSASSLSRHRRGRRASRRGPDRGPPRPRRRSGVR